MLIDKASLLQEVNARRPLSELELELSRVERELAEVEMERDFIKKCAAYFAKESR